MNIDEALALQSRLYISTYTTTVSPSALIVTGTHKTGIVTMDTIINASNQHRLYLFDQYPVMQNSHDEFFTAEATSRDQSKQIVEFFNRLGANKYHQHHQTAINLFKEFGVTFAMDAENEQNPFPFDLIPRIISKQDWSFFLRGIEQRTKAMNAFLFDIYHQQHILKNKNIPRELIESSSYYSPQLQHITPLGGVYIHRSGTDIVHDTQGNYHVLEDNLRTPSGVAYALTNRNVMHHLFPQMMPNLSIDPIHHYPQQLAKLLTSLIEMTEQDVAVILTPGTLNAAYYEHA